MSKTLVSIIVAVASGLVLIVLPLITFGEYRAQDHDYAPGFCWERLEGPEGSQINKIPDSSFRVEILAADFAVAFLVYLIFRRRIH